MVFFATAKRNRKNDRINMAPSPSLSRKQELYLKIFEWVLPFIRNVQTQPLLRRLGSGSLYPEAELVHNLAPLLLRPDFGKEDVWWLKYQGGQYIRAHKERGRPVGAEVVSWLEELASVVRS